MCSAKKTENQRRKPKQARSLAKYRAVLDACTQVLAEHGYEKTTILELSLTSGVAVPTIYQYFPNKESIFVAWLDDAIDQILDEVSRTADQQPPSDVDNFIQRILEQTLPTIDLYRDSIRNLLRDLPDILLSHALAAIRDKTTTTVSRIVTAQLGTETAEQLQPRLHILMQCILGYILQHVLMTQSAPMNRQVTEELSRLTISYLAG